MECESKGNTDCCQHSNLGDANVFRIDSQTNRRRPVSMTLFESLFYFFLLLSENEQVDENQLVEKLYGLLDLEDEFEKSLSYNVDSAVQVEERFSAIEVTACDTMAKEPFLGKKYIYLSAERVGAKDVYQKSQLQAGELGTQCQYVFDFLNRYAKEPMEEKEFIRDENFGKTLGNQVNYWLEYLVGYNIKTEDFRGTEIVRAMYIRKGSNRELRPVNVGTGISYISALVIAALSCRKGDTLFDQFDDDLDELLGL